MKATIAQLTRIAADLRHLCHTETEAPRLIREYLEMVPAQELRILCAEHAEALGEVEANLKEANEDQELAEKRLEEFEAEENAEIKKLEKQIDELQCQLDTALSERSDPGNPRNGDDTTIQAFTASLCEERARVRTLEAQLAAALADVVHVAPAAKQPVKPLDSRHAGKAGAGVTKAQARKATADKPPVAMATDRPTVTRNEEKGGIELRFNGKPDDVTRDAMKARKWRWCPGQPGQPWVVKSSEEEWLFAQSLATGSAFTPMPDTPEPETRDQKPESSENPPIHFPTMPAPAMVRKVALPDF